jgi:hypothetical protein
MKKVFLLSTVLASLFVLFLTSCNSNKTKGVTITSEDGKDKVTIDTRQMQNASTEMQKASEELQKLTPLSLDELKAMAPETLMGVKRSSYNASAAMGASVVTADYRMNDTTNMKLMVYDCAGQAGAGIYSMQYLSMMNMQSESDDEYTKTIDYNGGKAYEHCQKSSHECTITFFGGKRFLVTLEGENVSVDQLKQAGKELNVK